MKFAHTMCDARVIQKSEKLLYPVVGTPEHRSLLYDDLHALPVTKRPSTTRGLLAESIHRYCEDLANRVKSGELLGKWTENGTLLITTNERKVREKM
jgi:hypothetical protein